MLLFRLAFLPPRIALRVVRIVGVRRLVVFGAGVGAGLLLAPTTGAEMRQRLQRALEARRPVGDHDLAERVRFELSHSPRTWHLPQPVVEVQGAVAVLRGQVPHESGRADLERTAAAVAGVARVDNQVTVANGTGTS